MGGIAPAFGVTLSLYGVLDAALFQDAVEDRAVCFEGHSGAVWAAKGGAADLVLCQPVNDGLDFGETVTTRLRPASVLLPVKARSVRS